MGRRSGAWSLPAIMALGLALAGCASVEKTPGPPWRVEALWRVDNGVVPGSGAAYFALGRKYEGEGRWQQAAEAYRKATLAEPANAEYRSLSRRRGRKRALIAVAHALLVTCYHLLSKGEDYRDPLGSGEQQKPLAGVA